MSERADPVNENGEIRLLVRVVPRSRKLIWAGRRGDRHLIRLTAPPVDGKANDQLLAFLADAFGVPRRDVRIEHGATGRDKTVVIQSPTRLPEAIRSP
jgi:uncharacterized protein (TIGR00251 family)